MRFNAYKSSISVLFDKEAIGFLAIIEINGNKIVKNFSLE